MNPAGFEPATPWFVARYSFQLSYGFMWSRCPESNRGGKICSLQAQPLTHIDTLVMLVVRTGIEPVTSEASAPRSAC